MIRRPPAVGVAVGASLGVAVVVPDPDGWRSHVGPRAACDVADVA